jgi:hypothetical protein
MEEIRTVSKIKNQMVTTEKKRKQNQPHQTRYPMQVRSKKRTT